MIALQSTKVYASEISAEGFENSWRTSGLATSLEDWTWVLISAKDGSSSGSKNKIDSLKIEGGQAK